MYYYHLLPLPPPERDELLELEPEPDLDAVEEDFFDAEDWADAEELLEALDDCVVDGRDDVDAEDPFDWLVDGLVDGLADTEDPPEGRPEELFLL